jgi:hypothetical protein
MVEDLLEYVYRVRLAVTILNSMRTVCEQCYRKGPRESLEPFDRDPTVEILQVTWRDVRLGNEPGFRLLKILRLF